MKIRIEISDNIPKHLHDKIAKNCLREFSDYNEPIIGAVVYKNRIIENIKYEFHISLTKNNVVIILIFRKLWQ